MGGFVGSLWSSWSSRFAKLVERGGFGAGEGASWFCAVGLSVGKRREGSCEGNSHDYRTIGARLFIYRDPVMASAAEF